MSREASEWEVRYWSGQINLADALMMMLHQGIAPTQLFTQQIERAFIAYNDGDFDDLAEGFGCRVPPSDKRAMKHQTWLSQVRQEVEVQVSRGKAKSHPTQNQGTAFHAAGDALSPKLSALSVFDIYYHRRREPGKRAQKSTARKSPA